MVTDDKSITGFQAVSPTTRTYGPEIYLDIRDLVQKENVTLPRFIHSRLLQPAAIQTKRNDLALYDSSVNQFDGSYDHSSFGFADYFNKLNSIPVVWEKGGLINGDLVLYQDSLGSFYQATAEQRAKFSDDEGRLTADPQEIIERLYLEICTERSGFPLNNRNKLLEKKSCLSREDRAQLDYFRPPSIDDVMNRAYRNVENSEAKLREVIGEAWEKAEKLPEREWLSEMDKLEYALAEVLQVAYVGKKKGDISKTEGKVINEFVDKLRW